MDGDTDVFTLFTWFPSQNGFFWLNEKFASEAPSNFADIVDTISRSYDKADGLK